MESPRTCGRLIARYPRHLFRLETHPVHMAAAGLPCEQTAVRLAAMLVGRPSSQPPVTSARAPGLEHLEQPERAAGVDPPIVAAGSAPLSAVCRNARTVPRMQPTAAAAAEAAEAARIGARQWVARASWSTGHRRDSNAHAAPAPHAPTLAGKTRQNVTPSRTLTPGPEARS